MTNCLDSITLEQVFQLLLGGNGLVHPERPAEARRRRRVGVVDVRGGGDGHRTDHPAGLRIQAWKQRSVIDIVNVLDNPLDPQRPAQRGHGEARDPQHAPINCVLAEDHVGAQLGGALLQNTVTVSALKNKSKTRIGPLF